MRNDTDSEENEVTPRDHQGRSATVRDQASGALSAARRSVAQDNAPINTPDNDLNDKVRKAVWAMTDEERLAFRKAAKDLEKFVKTKRAYRPPPLAAVAGSDKAPRTTAPDSVQAKVLETPPVTAAANLSGIHGKMHGEGNASGLSVVRGQEGWAFGFGMG